MSSATALSIPKLTAPSTAGVVPRLDGVSDQRLAEAFQSARDIARARARNFYYGLRLTPEPRRSAVFAIYAWMRFGDDRVDDTRDLADKRRELDSFRTATESILAADPAAAAPDSPMWLALAATLRSYPIDHTHIRAMIDGLEEDIDHAGYETIEDLERYCYRVASTVGLVCVSIWGFRAGVTIAQCRDATALSERRGKAFQLTNILRDFAEDFDAEHARVYLPRQVLESHRLTAADLRAWREPSRCEGLVMELATRAKGHYAASSPLDELIDPACRSTLYAMTRIYEGLLDLIIARPDRLVRGGRIRLSSATKATIAAAAVVRGGLDWWPATTMNAGAPPRAGDGA
ncbi:MAG: squalene/phytoene synthase family protein [Phycisphaerales bacterium]|nr:squalene/phytoene synthase family protein [Phycisphaerales bacterium]